MRRRLRVIELKNDIAGRIDSRRRAGSLSEKRPGCRQEQQGHAPRTHTHSVNSLFDLMSSKTGVVLFQLGGPDSRESIEPFLYNLFSDPDIIDFPFAKLARKPLAKIIASNRAKHVAHHYAEIGGKSPILDYTRRQAEALERELRRE